MSQFEGPRIDSQSTLQCGFPREGSHGCPIRLDVADIAQNAGRYDLTFRPDGTWTWVGVHVDILGWRRDGSTLVLDPIVPADKYTRVMFGAHAWEPLAGGT